MFSNIIQNPFASPRSQGQEINKGSQGGPNNPNPSPSPTNNNPNPGFNPPGQDPNNNNNEDPLKSNNPMDDIKGFWDDPVPDPKNPPKEFKSYLPEVDPAKFKENLGRLDFSKSVNPETMKKMFGHSEEALAAAPDFINTLGRQFFELSFNASSKMAETGFTNAEKRFMEDLIPNSMQNRMVDDALFQDNPLAQDPRYRGMFKTLKDQAMKKFPKASPDEIKNYVNTYVDDFAKSKTAPTQKQDDNNTLLKKGSEGADWEEWIKT